MKKLLITTVVATSFVVTPLVASAGPAEDQAAFVEFFKKRFPKVALDEFKNGVNAIDEGRRAQWLEAEEFPPYEFAVDEGKAIWEKAFANGKTFESCLGKANQVRSQFPKVVNGKVQTLEEQLNACREANGEKPFKYKKGKIAKLSAYLGYVARGQKTNVAEPKSAEELAAYELGKNMYYRKSGQLNMSCADCHMYYSGQKARANILSPSLGALTHFPVYRKKWGGLGTLHRRFAGCHKNIRAKPFKAQGKEYKALEYFMAYMNNGQEINAPGSRE